VNSRGLDITKVKFDEQVEQMVLSVLRGGMIAQGPIVEAMEREVALVADVRHAMRSAMEPHR
jgi:dTDP-4-amino-4,6-dideoxygalactose transaminase